MEKNKVKPPKKYDKMHRELIDYIMSGQMHSTSIGKVVSVNNTGSKNDLRDIEEFVEYTVSLIKKAEAFRKDNVKED